MPQKVVLTVSPSPQTNQTVCEVFGRLLAILFEKSAISKADTIPTAMAALSGPSPPTAVIILESIAERSRENSALIAALKSYVSVGGRLIFCGVFPSFAQWADMDRLFKELGLDWKSGSYTRDDCLFNYSVGEVAWERGASPGSDDEYDGEPGIRFDGLPAAYSMKALRVTVTNRSDVLYGPKYSLDQAAAAWRKMKNGGGIGYVGDVNGEIEATAVVLAMCGIN